MHSKRLLGAVKLCPLAGLMIAALFWQLPSPAQAASFTTTSTTDAVDANPGDGLCATVAGECTLRAAIQETNALAGPDTIELVAGTYTRSIGGFFEDAAATGDLDITDDVTITGTATDETIIDAGGLDRVFHVVGLSTVMIEGVTLRNGNAGGGNGGGIYNAGSLTLNNVSVSGNTASGGNGGGIASDGTTATLTLRDTSVSDNTALGILGGGIYNHLGDMEVTDSTIAGNTLAGGFGFGGGVQNSGGSATLTNVTISGNLVTSKDLGHGGGIGNVQENIFGPASAGTGTFFATMTLTNVTVAGNTASDGGGIRNYQYNNLKAKNSIIANNLLGGDCSGPIGVDSYSLDSDGTCGLATGDPLLGSLADNGGATRTHALLAGSPAIDAGSPDCPAPATDQRGAVRPQGAACDIGAFEVGGVGGIAELPEAAGTSLEAGGSSGPRTGVLAGIAAAAATGAVALGGAAWYARRRRSV